MSDIFDDATIHVAVVEQTLVAVSVDPSVVIDAAISSLVPVNVEIGLPPLGVPQQQGGVPDGGRQGQALVKRSNADFDVAWKDTSRLVIVGATPLSGHSAVTIDANGTLVYADCMSPPTKGAAIGITANAYGSEQYAEVVTAYDIVFEGWAWAPGPVLAGPAGALVQTIPTGATFLQVIGFAVSATRIRVSPQPPIMLA